VFVEVPFEMANSMQAGLVASSSAHPRPFPAIVVGGLIVGAVDLLYAIAVYSPRHPILIPQTIASGILGAKSYSEGTYSSALGIVLQFVIALGAATVYYLASRRLKFLVSHAIPSGLTYGALVYLFMHIVVLPLSAVPKGDTPFVYMAFEFVEHWFCVGLPIALSVDHYSH
jgi:uncharacterized membrane protein YagU involved in acid resistance